MEDEKNENVDTQTTGAENNQNIDNSAKEIEQQEEQTQNGGEKETNAEDLSKAFGNSTGTNKNEGEKEKKTNSVAKTNEDGSITFKNQEELNRFIDRIYRKGANNSQNSKQNQTGEQRVEQLQGKQENTEQNANDGRQASKNVEQNQVLPSDYYNSKIGLAMVTKGVNFAKVERASRLVDTSKVVVNGAIDEAALNSEIEAVLAEFPELKNTEAENNAQAGFKFGASKEENQSAADADAISEAFGNKKG